MNKLFFSLVGATLLLGSAVALIDCAVSKRKKSRGATAVQAVVGMAGLIAGTVVALQPEVKRYEATVVHDMVTDEDEGMLHKHISEVLGDAADRGPAATHVRKIEVDDDTTIDDFIFN